MWAWEAALLPIGFPAYRLGTHPRRLRADQESLRTACQDSCSRSTPARCWCREEFLRVAMAFPHWLLRSSAPKSVWPVVWLRRTSPKLWRLSRGQIDIPHTWATTVQRYDFFDSGLCVRFRSRTMP